MDLGSGPSTMWALISTLRLKFMLNTPSKHFPIAILAHLPPGPQATDSNLDWGMDSAIFGTWNETAGKLDFLNMTMDMFRDGVQVTNSYPCRHTNNSKYKEHTRAHTHKSILSNKFLLKFWIGISDSFPSSFVF